MKEENRPFTTAVILAAGSGTRMNLDKTKQQIKILGKTVLQRAVEAFDLSSFVDEIIVVCRASEEDFARAETKHFGKVKKVVKGGKTRAESSKIGFECIDDKSRGYVLIHDAARCLITTEDIGKIANAAYEHGCASASNYISDTLKNIDCNEYITGTVPREEVRTVQTPQAFFNPIIHRAFEACNDTLEHFTDDNMLVEKTGGSIVCVPTSKSNIKITTVDDIDYAEYIILKRQKNDI